MVIGQTAAPTKEHIGGMIRVGSFQPSQFFAAP
jgi:hypothetical protein